MCPTTTDCGTPLQTSCRYARSKLKSPFVPLRPTAPLRSNILRYCCINFCFYYICIASLIPAAIVTSALLCKCHSEVYLYPNSPWKLGRGFRCLLYLCDQATLDAIFFFTARHTNCSRIIYANFQMVKTHRERTILLPLRRLAL